MNLFMRSQAQTIYEVTTQSIGSLNTIRQREPFTVYFSNLTKAVDTLKSQLALNGWPPKLTIRQLIEVYTNGAGINAILT